jgi:hypothetical protein
MFGSADAQSRQITSAGATPLPAKMGAAAEDKAIRPSRINISEQEISTPPTLGSDTVARPGDCH